MPKNYYDTWHATKRGSHSRAKTYPWPRTQDDITTASRQTTQTPNSVTLFPPEDIARQITLLDSAAFNQIPAHEFRDYGRKKGGSNMIKNCSNRFNQTTFWARSDILANWDCKRRAESITCLIKLSKCLLDLGNLQGFAAIVTALTSAPIARLRLTWPYVSKRDRSTLEKFGAIVDPEGAYTNMRALLPSQGSNGVNTPGSLGPGIVPFLGMFLQDLEYLLSVRDMDSRSEAKVTDKVTNIVNTLVSYQSTNYGFEENREISSMLRANSCVEIEALMKICESDQYRRSEELEPPELRSPRGHYRKGSGGDLLEVNAQTSTLSAGQGHSGRGHRKSKSLGGNNSACESFFRRDRFSRASIYSISTPTSDRTNPGNSNQSQNSNVESSPRHLLDDSLTSNDLLADEMLRSPLRPNVVTTTTISEHWDRSQRQSWDSNASSGVSDTGILRHNMQIGTPNGTSGLHDHFRHCGCLRKKVTIRHGKKTLIRMWTKYWITLSHDGMLTFYQHKANQTQKPTSNNHESQFSRDACKRLDLSKSSWSVQRCEQRGYFLLKSEVLGKEYRFDAGESHQVDKWLAAIEACTNLIRLD